MKLLASLHLLCAALGAVAWTSTPFSPASIPLAVRTPYLSAWLPQGSGAALNDVWPTFWTGSTLGWAGYVKVDGKTYTFLGAPTVSGANKATQKSMTFTATQSTFVLTAGPVDVTVNFLSPVEPNDLVRQSLPFAYMAVTIAPNDAKSHSVQVYSDISGEWLGAQDEVINWSTSTGNALTHQIQLTTQQVNVDSGDRIQQGSAFYSLLSTPGTTYRTGSDATTRAAFIANSKLDNTEDKNFRQIQDSWPVFALAQDLGTISIASSPVVFVVGHARDPVATYITASGNKDRNPYYSSKYSIADALTAFLSDYSGSLQRAKAFDSKIQSDASAVSLDYAGLVSLSVRQAFGAIEITVSSNGNSYNTDDVLVFMKEISSDGNLNTIDVIFPSWPLWIYTNPALGKYMLLPHYEYQVAGLYPNTWAVHDMGSSYPRALGHNDGNDEKMPIEECGNHLIMALSYTKNTGDKSLISQYSTLIDQWTQFLITDSLIPADQISTDDFAGSLANQTNLAIKGIIGIKASSEIFSLLGDTNKANNYSSIAASYVTKWQGYATSADGSHLKLAYDQDSSWGLAYNLFGEKLTGVSIFPSSVYSTITSWYKSHDNAFGVPLDTRHTYTKSDWEIWTAAIVTDKSVRDMFISNVVEYASSGKNRVPTSDLYDTVSGSVSGFQARPVVGGHLALLV